MILCLCLIGLSACQTQKNKEPTLGSAYGSEPAFKGKAGPKQQKMWSTYVQTQAVNGVPVVVMFLAEQQGLMHRPGQAYPVGLEDWPMTEIRMYYENVTVVIDLQGNRELKPASPHMLEAGRSKVKS